VSAPALSGRAIYQDFRGVIPLVFMLKPRVRRLLAILLCISGLTLIGAGVVGNWGARHTSGKPQPLYGVTTRKQEVALTFDISWGEVMPPTVADILREQCVQATIFLSGPYSSKHPDLVRQLAADGHEMASHGWLHKNMSSYSRDQIVDSIQKTHDVIKDLTGQEARFIRPPNGDFNDRVVQTAAEMGYTVVIWSLDSLDWLNPGVQKIVDRVLTRVKPGDVILMHASDTCKQTDQALPAIIQGLRGQGLSIVTLGALLKGAAEPE
jgi:peptidoglycan-N-acetylglucosamine deacetylase